MATKTKTTETVKKEVILIKPYITEKSNALVETTNVYTFEVLTGANKKNIGFAIQKMYKVTPTKISIAKNPAKKVFARGKVGSKPGVTKAYVYLKKGDKIEFV